MKRPPATPPRALPPPLCGEHYLSVPCIKCAQEDRRDGMIFFAVVAIPVLAFAACAVAFIVHLWGLSVR